MSPFQSIHLLQVLHSVGETPSLGPKISFIHSLHAFQSAFRCLAADILWQPSRLPRLGISSTMCTKALQTGFGAKCTGTSHIDARYTLVYQKPPLPELLTSSKE